MAFPQDLHKSAAKDAGPECGLLADCAGRVWTTVGPMQHAASRAPCVFFRHLPCITPIAVRPCEIQCWQMMRRQSPQVSGSRGGSVECLAMSSAGSTGHVPRMSRVVHRNPPREKSRWGRLSRIVSRLSSSGSRKYILGISCPLPGARLELHRSGFSSLAIVRHVDRSRPSDARDRGERRSATAAFGCARRTLAGNGGRSGGASRASLRRRLSSGTWVGFARNFARRTEQGSPKEQLMLPAGV